ncbi:MAG: hypothetical protein H8E82_06805 [Candidatus Marinimicrobia bacterium]|nr:hypothetical protein [Candidatus Neomarinimicrobiota bacterium]MBL7046976.1 hypothetical protein [Candidatus Neomarinimicrobiota bacterium]
MKNTLLTFLIILIAFLNAQTTQNTWEHKNFSRGEIIVLPKNKNRFEIGFKSCASVAKLNPSFVLREPLPAWMAILPFCPTQLSLYLRYKLSHRFFSKIEYNQVTYKGELIYAGIRQHDITFKFLYPQLEFNIINTRHFCWSYGAGPDVYMIAEKIGGLSDNSMEKLKIKATKLHNFRFGYHINGGFFFRFYVSKYIIIFGFEAARYWVKGKVKGLYEDYEPKNVAVGISLGVGFSGRIYQKK